MSNAAVVLGKTSVYDGSMDLYNRFKENKYFGVYGFPSSPPILVVKDLHLLNHILGESTMCMPKHGGTGLPAYSDSAGTLKKCHCKRGVSYCVTVSEHFYCMKVKLGVQTSVTV